MEKVKPRVNSVKTFSDLWSEAKVEIFRLELLNIYSIDYEIGAFNKYKQGKPVDVFKEVSGFNEWLSKAEQTVKRGVSIVDIQVLDLPMSDYIKFGIKYGSLFAEQKGEKFLFIERKNVSDLIKGFSDYWMFDSSTVMLMNYDSEGHLLSRSNPIKRYSEVSRYLELKDKLLHIGIPMQKFLRDNDINLG
jgi:hypothetical protein